MSKCLQNRVIFISGGSSGIGAAAVAQCARAGMNVAFCGRHLETLEQVAKPLREEGHQILPLVADVGDRQSLEQALAYSMEHWGRLDAVFANAGYGIMKSVLDTTPEESAAIFRTNYEGTLHLIQLAMPHLRATPDRLGHILICASAASKVAIPLWGVYSATKAAQDSLATALRAEIAGEGYHVSAIYPVGTRTKFFQAAGTRDDINSPKWMIQTPDQVASSVLRCLQKPRPEIWPCLPVRYAIAHGIAFPRIIERLMRKRHQELTRNPDS